MAETENTRAKVATRTYVNDEGKESRSPQPDTYILKLTFANGVIRKYDARDLADSMRVCLGMHGLSQKEGDTWAGAKGDVDAAIEGADSMWEQLLAGTWTERGEGVGPQPSLVVEAIVRALTSAGETVDDARRASIQEKCKDKATRDGALKDKAINAAYKAIQAERAAERAKAAAKEAEGATVGVTGF